MPLRNRLYDLVRRVHLYTGLGLLAFVVMYFVTGYVMIHGDWFDDGEDVEEERTVAIPRPPEPPLDAYAVWLQHELDVPGKRTAARRQKDGSHRFEYWRPGTLHRLDVAADGATARWTTRHETLRSTLAGFHRMHGYGGGWIYDAWVFIYDLASLSLILFAISGVVLWWRLTRRRLWGWLCLALSWGFAALTVGWLMYSP